MIEQINMKHVIQKHVHVICTGVVQLGSPAAAAIAPNYYLALFAT